MSRSFSLCPYLCSELVSITRNDASRSESVQGNLESIGERSAMVLTHAAFPRGTAISIQANSHILRGSVKRCRYDQLLGCYIEVRLKPESRWSEQWFRPQHLLTLGGDSRAGKASRILTLNGASVTENVLRAGWRSRCNLRRANRAGGFGGEPLMTVRDSALRQVFES
jgi:hypothetical protein